MEARATYGPWRERPRLTVVTDGGATYSALPHVVMRDTSLSRDARLLYAILQGHWWQGGECWASHATLAEEMGCKPRMLRYYIRELVAAGYITERRHGHGQAKAYAPADQTSQAARDCQLNRQEDAASGSKRQEIATQAATGYPFKRQPVADLKKTPEEDSSGRKKTGVGAANAAAQPKAGKPKATSSGDRRTRCPESFPLEAKHFAYGASLGFGEARVRSETAKFLDHHRFKGTLGLDWYAGWQKWMRNAVQFDSERPAPHRNGNGAAPAPPTRDVASKWAGFKGRHGSNLDPVGPTDGR